MNIRIEIDESIEEDEVVIRCKKPTALAAAVQRAVEEAAGGAQKLVLYKENKEYHLMADEILFFETDGNGISAHTRAEAYQTRSKLYELEKILPASFVRVSKSAILNMDHIYSIDRNLAASSVVAFEGTHKQVYVSRYYHRMLIKRLEEKRSYR